MHGRLVNEIVELGNVFKLEKLSYRAFQKEFGRSVGLRAPGGFVSELRRKAESAGGKVIEFPIRNTRLSQRCHCGQVHKKRLSERWQGCACGVFAQRDLYSAFLARFVEQETNQLHAGQAAEAWTGAEPLLRTAWQQAVTNQPASGRSNPSSFGATRSWSGSSVEGEIACTKARDVVAYPLGTARARER
ncbi:MAG: zinc ribbon domain-containing protein [Firmicutes bacterium]|nr:zinc ribbon domain-containing protein [Bacillota bacterium]